MKRTKWFFSYPSHYRPELKEIKEGFIRKAWRAYLKCTIVGMDTPFEIFKAGYYANDAATIVQLEATFDALFSKSKNLNSD